MFIEIPNIKISHISACVPKETVRSEDEKFIQYTGIKQRRVTNLCASDLCYEAAKGITDIDVLIFVSQTPDYSIPSTSIILQERLGLKDVMAFDISMSCSGWVYGLSVIASLIKEGKRGLLLVGDTLSRVCSKEDQSTYPIFGDCGTATLIEWEQGNNMQFQMNCDGDGFESIIISDSGMRKPVNMRSFEDVTYGEGITRKSTNLAMDGLAVFFFAQKRVPESIKLLSLKYLIEDVDYYVFHQSNKFMIESICRKLKIPLEKVPMSLEYFGNTSSASIPLTMVHNSIKGKVIACGYGAGLSWGSVYLNLNSTYKFTEI
jgi:3-oxoacyl-[acyl-carrier-protein] synthase-3